MIGDQAQQLRILASQLKTPGEAGALFSNSHLRCISIVSGKGGVGKTNFAVNLSILLARSGKRVLLLDADWGLGNVDTVLGVSPKYTIQHFVKGEKDLAEIVMQGPDNLLFIANGSGMQELANLELGQRERIISSLANLERVADILIIDSGAGVSRNVLSFAMAASEIVVVTNPEPTAIRDAYATIKVISQENKDCQIDIVVNRASTGEEALAVAKRIANAADYFLQLKVGYKGFVFDDKYVQSAITRRKPFISLYPNAPASKCMGDIALNLGLEQPRKSTGLVDLFRRVSGVFG